MNKINQLRRIITLNQTLLRKELRSPSCDRERVQIMFERYKRWIELNRFFEKELEFDFMLKLLDYDIPMNEIVMDFYDKLKSTTKGYASFDYEPVGFRPGILQKLDIKVAGEVVDALSIIVPENKALTKGREFIKALKELIPRQLFEVAIQADIS